MTNTTALVDSGHIVLSERDGVAVRFLPVAAGVMNPRQAAFLVVDSLRNEEDNFIDPIVLAAVACEDSIHGYGVKVTVRLD